MKTLPLLVLLCAVTPLVSCQESAKNSTTLKPDSGNFAQNTYRNDFFGFSYPLPEEWHKSRVSPSPLPSGAYYLFIGDRDTGHSLLNRVMVVADPESDSRPHSAQEYLSALVRAEVRQAHAEVTREPSSFASGGSDLYQAAEKLMDTVFFLPFLIVGDVERVGFRVFRGLLLCSIRNQT
ncbi:MAG: hypothetical protein ABSD64_05730, partial [Terriglobales bacterium]